MSSDDNSNGNLCAAGTGNTLGTGTTMGSLIKPTSSSTEDLSEYTDADESISAPTEFLAEFLSAVMLKDYETALKYCKLILQYEPNNVTAKEFYPLIVEKLQNTYNKQTPTHHPHPTPSTSSSSPSPTPDSSSSESSGSSSSSECEGEGDGDPEEEDDEDGSDEPCGKRCSSDGDATTASYSSLEDEEAEQERDDIANVGVRERVDNVNLGNGNRIFCDSRGAAWEIKGMDSKGPVAVPFGTSSDSESPTEPVSQQTIAMLRAKVVAARH